MCVDVWIGCMNLTVKPPYSKWHTSTTKGFSSFLFFTFLSLCVNAYTLLFTFLSVLPWLFSLSLSISSQFVTCLKTSHFVSVDSFSFLSFFFLNNYLLNFDVHKRLSTFSTQIDATKIRHGNSNFAILILRFAIRNTRVNLAKMAHYDWALHLQCTIDKSQFSVNWIPLKSLGFRLALQFEINKSREEEEKRR